MKKVPLWILWILVETQELAHYAGYKIPQEVGVVRLFTYTYMYMYMYRYRYMYIYIYTYVFFMWLRKSGVCHKQMEDVSLGHQFCWPTGGWSRFLKTPFWRCSAALVSCWEKILYSPLQHLQLHSGTGYESWRWLALHAGSMDTTLFQVQVEWWTEPIITMSCLRFWEEIVIFWPL